MFVARAYCPALGSRVPAPLMKFSIEHCLLDYFIVVSSFVAICGLRLSWAKFSVGLSLTTAGLQMQFYIELNGFSSVSLVASFQFVFSVLIL